MRNTHQPQADAEVTVPRCAARQGGRGVHPAHRHRTVCTHAASSRRIWGYPSPDEPRSRQVLSPGKVRAAVAPSCGKCGTCDRDVFQARVRYRAPGLIEGRRCRPPAGLRSRGCSSPAGHHRDGGKRSSRCCGTPPPQPGRSGLQLPADAPAAHPPGALAAANLLIPDGPAQWRNPRAAAAYRKQVMITRAVRQ